MVVIVIVAAVLGFTMTSARGQAPTCVDIQLAIGIDASGSMGHSYIAEVNRQVADAFLAPEVADHVSSAETGRLAVAVYHWSSRILDSTGWMVVEANDLPEIPAAVQSAHARSSMSTGIGHALRYARELFWKSDLCAVRRHVVVIGDGVNNTGPEPRPIAVEMDRYQKITVSAVSIVKDEKQREKLRRHFAREVIQGRGRFLVEAFTPEEYREAIIRSLLMERYACVRRGVC